MSGFTEDFQKAQQGGHSALDRLHGRFRSGVRLMIRWCRNYTLKRHYDTTDLEHSVFLEFFLRVPGIVYRGERALWGYLARLTKNEVWGKGRRHALEEDRRSLIARALEDRRSGIPEPEFEIIQREQKEAVQAACCALKESHREVVRLRIFDRLSHSEVAEEMGLSSADAARKLQVRALKQLRRICADPEKHISMSLSA